MKYLALSSQFMIPSMHTLYLTTPWNKIILTLDLAKLVVHKPNLRLDTDMRTLFQSDPAALNWEISADRANITAFLNEQVS